MVDTPTSLVQYGHLVLLSASSVLWGFLMMASIFFRYFSSMSFLYSGLMRVAAWVKAEFFRPDLWHSMTVEVRMGTI